MNKAQKIDKYLNQAAIVLELAGRHFKDKAMTIHYARTTPFHSGPQPPSLCSIHGLHSPLFPHERTRILDCWYYLKFLSILYELHDEERLLKDQMIQVRALSIVDLYMLWSLSTFVTDRLEETQIREYLEVEDDNSYGRDLDVNANPTTDAWEWVDSFIAETYGKKRNYGFDDYEAALKGLVDVCPEESGLGHCSGKRK